MTDNGDGTYDLWSDDACTFIGVGYEDSDGYYAAEDNGEFGVTKIEVIFGHTLKSTYNMAFFSGTSTSLFAFLNDVTEITWHGACRIDFCMNMFAQCNNLKRLVPDNFFDGLSPWEVSGMFLGCASLEHINLSGCDFSNAGSFSRMFENCSSATYITPMNFMAGAAPYGMSGMFKNMINIEHVSFEGVDFSQCSDMSELFYGCGSLACITNIDTTHADYKDGMFTGCDSLVQPDSTAVSDLTDSDGAAWVNPGVCSGIRVFRQKESLQGIRLFEQKESLMTTLSQFSQSETYPEIYSFTQKETYPEIYSFTQKESLMSVLSDFTQKESLMTRASVFSQLESYEHEKVYSVSVFRQIESLETVVNREKVIKVVPV